MSNKFNIWDQDSGWDDNDPKYYKFLAKIKGTDFYFVTDYYKSAEHVESVIQDSKVILRIDETGMEIK